MTIETKQIIDLKLRGQIFNFLSCGKFPEKYYMGNPFYLILHDKEFYHSKNQEFIKDLIFEYHKIKDHEI